MNLSWLLCAIDCFLEASGLCKVSSMPASVTTARNLLPLAPLDLAALFSVGDSSGVGSSNVTCG